MNLSYIRDNSESGFIMRLSLNFNAQKLFLDFELQKNKRKLLKLASKRQSYRITLDLNMVKFSVHKPVTS